MKFSTLRLHWPEPFFLPTPSYRLRPELFSYEHRIEFLASSSRAVADFQPVPQDRALQLRAEHLLHHRGDCDCAAAHGAEGQGGGRPRSADSGGVHPPHAALPQLPLLLPLPGLLPGTRRRSHCIDLPFNLIGSTLDSADRLLVSPFTIKNIGRSCTGNQGSGYCAPRF